MYPASYLSPPRWLTFLTQHIGVPAQLTVPLCPSSLLLSLLPPVLCWDNSHSVLDLGPGTSHLLGKTSTSLTRSEPSTAVSWCRVPHLHSIFFFFFFTVEIWLSPSLLLASFVITFVLFWLIITLVALTQYSVYNNYVLNEQRIVAGCVLRRFSYYSSDTIECLPLWESLLFLTSFLSNNFLGIKEGYLIKLSHPGQQTALQKKKQI